MTEIRYDIPAPGGEIRLVVLDVAGRGVRTLVAGRQLPGRQAIVWDGRNDAGAAVPSGVYFYRMTMEGFARTRKMTLVK